MNKSPLKIIFAGTPEFAASALQALFKTPHDIIAVYTQPDRPAGRGLHLQESPVKALAKEKNIPIYQPKTLKDIEAQKMVADLNADIMIVAAYGLLLPQAVLAAPRLGCINIHASLLPRWRGAAPIQRAILAGDNKTGITIMQMDAGLDTGPMLLKAECAISSEDTSGKLHDRLAELGANTLLKALEQIDTLQASPQDAAQSTHAAKISKEEARINWQNTALAIDRQVRAFHPWPVAHTSFGGEVLRIHEAKALADKSSAAPGTIAAVSKQGLDIATQDGILRILKIQAPGGKPLAIGDFLNARQKDFVVGAMFE